MAYFLDEIKYEINGFEIDKTRFVGMRLPPYKIIYLWISFKVKIY